MTLQTSFLSLQDLRHEQFDCPAAECFGELHKPGVAVSPKWAAQGTSDTYAFTFPVGKLLCLSKYSPVLNIMMTINFNQRYTAYTTQCDT